MDLGLSLGTHQEPSEPSISTAGGFPDPVYNWCGGIAPGRDVFLVTTCFSPQLFSMGLQVQRYHIGLLSPEAKTWYMEPQAAYHRGLPPLRGRKHFQKA
jgi:hypothetical protein